MDESDPDDAPSFPPRLPVLLARDAKIGVVLRRGPAKQVAAIGGDRRTDEFRLGQWLKGRIYERRSDLARCVIGCGGRRSGIVGCRDVRSLERGRFRRHPFLHVKVRLAVGLETGRIGRHPERNVLAAEMRCERPCRLLLPTSLNRRCFPSSTERCCRA